MANKWDERKKAQEDEYFVKKEKELLEKLKAKQEHEAKETTKNAGNMRCPKCGEPLAERTFRNIVVDECTGCRGTWLDAGKLEQVAGMEGQGWLRSLWQKRS